MLASSKKMDAVICLGCVIKGETSHNEYISKAVATGLCNLSMVSGKPFISAYLLLTMNNKPSTGRRKTRQ